MNEAEVRMLLALATSLDNRKVNNAMITLWFTLFRGYAYGEAKWALMHHATTSTDYLMPGHIIQIINWKRSEYALMNPARGHNRDAWVEFEERLELAAQEVRKVRETGKPYAVDVMDGYETKELEG